MARYKVTRAYGNSQFFANEGDVVEIDNVEADRLEADSPGTFERIEEQATSDAVEAGLLTEHGAAVKEELEAQIKTIDLDVEDKAKEIPGEGNKYTPASGYQVSDGGVRVVERAPANRQVTGASKRDEVAPADTSASARVTDSTPASEAADAAQLADGVTAQDADEDAKAKKAAAANEANAANKGTMTTSTNKATKKG